jgi:hypothetical protein
MSIFEKIVAQTPFDFLFCNKKWKVIFDPKVDRSYTHFFELRIVLKNPIDFVHELFHVLLHEDLKESFSKQEEEFFVQLISMNLERFLAENNYFVF